MGTIAGLLCIGLASMEKISNYVFGLINVTLFAIIFFQIQLYASLAATAFLLRCQHLWLVRLVAADHAKRGGT